MLTGSHSKKHRDGFCKGDYNLKENQNRKFRKFESLNSPVTQKEQKHKECEIFSGRGSNGFQRVLTKLSSSMFL